MMMKNLDAQFNRTITAKARWKAAEEAENKIMLRAAVKLGVKKRAVGRLTYEQSRKIRAAKNPDVVAAEKATERAMNKHIHCCEELFKMYVAYRKAGGEQISSYYAAATEWDDND